VESRPSIEIHLLGPIRLTIDGQDVQLGGPRQQALLALLALRPGRPWTPDELIEELWTGEPTSGAETTLRSYVSRLRRALGEAASIERGNGGYILHVTPAAVDAIAFEAAVRSAGEAMARGATRIARQQLGAALATWQGTPFGDLAGDGTLQAAATRLEERRLLALERRIEADLELGRAAEVVDELEGLVHDHPFREALWRHLMLALYRQGRQADALAAYHRARAQLDEHLGIEPGPELRELEAAILRQDVPEVARSAAQWNLPVALTSFIGRAVELEEVGRLIDSNRLVTLTGVGGVGKTRLAIEAARAAAGTFDDGIWFVDQAPLADPELVAATVANVLGIAHPASSPPIASIANQLGDRRILLILDNCEHLRDACAELAAGLLAGAAGVHILATSRVTLGISGEVDYAVPPLGAPGTGRRG
jgi:DNA-binding SARP family transcriptional activator